MGGTTTRLLSYTDPRACSHKCGAIPSWHSCGCEHLSCLGERLGERRGGCRNGNSCAYAHRDQVIRAEIYLRGIWSNPQTIVVERQYDSLICTRQPRGSQRKETTYHRRHSQMLHSVLRPGSSFPCDFCSQFPAKKSIEKRTKLTSDRVIPQMKQHFV